MEGIGEDNQKARKIGRGISHKFTLGLEHDKIRAQWASNIMSKNMLERFDGADGLRWNLEVEPFVA